MPFEKMEKKKSKEREKEKEELKRGGDHLICQGPEELAGRIVFAGVEPSAAVSVLKGSVTSPEAAEVL